MIALDCFKNDLDGRYTRMSQMTSVLNRFAFDAKFFFMVSLKCGVSDTRDGVDALQSGKFLQIKIYKTHIYAFHDERKVFLF